LNPRIMDGKVESGIPGLDELLNGGFPVGGTYVILGESGTGKSILSLEFLVNGAVKYDEPGVYIMLEEDKERMISNMKAFGWDLAKLEQEKKLEIVPYIRSIVGDVESSFEKSMLAGEQGRVEQLRQYLTMDSLFKEIEDCVERIGAKRVVIDPLTIVTLLASEEVVARMQILWLVEKLKKLNVTTIATIEQGVSYWMDCVFLTDGAVYLMLKEKEGMYERGLMVRKVRGTSHDTSVRPFKITEEGVKVYPEEVVFS